MTGKIRDSSRAGKNERRNAGNEKTRNKKPRVNTYPWEKIQPRSVKWGFLAASGKSS